MFERFKNSEKIEVGSFVVAQCVHEEVGEVRGVVYEVFEDQITLFAAPDYARGYTCKSDTATVVPDSELSEQDLAKAKAYRK